MGYFFILYNPNDWAKEYKNLVKIIINVINKLLKNNLINSANT